MTRPARFPLAGQHVWLTRPAHQCAAWSAGLEAAGARVSVEPLMHIAPPEDENAARQALARAEQADIVIATSPNAIRSLRRLRPAFAPVGELFAVGDATAGALCELTRRRVQAPGAFDTSEGLLDMSGLMDVRHCSIALLSGQGGRRKLMATLTRRGAEVDKVALYRRDMVAIGCQRLATLVTDNNAAVVTSGEAVRHLCALLRTCDSDRIRRGLTRLQLVVPSPRVVQLTPEDLFQRPPRAAARMTVEAVVAELASCGMPSENNHF